MTQIWVDLYKKEAQLPGKDLTMTWGPVSKSFQKGKAILGGFVIGIIKPHGQGRWVVVYLHQWLLPLGKSIITLFRV